MNLEIWLDLFTDDSVKKAFLRACQDVIKYQRYSLADAVNEVLHSNGLSGNKIEKLLESNNYAISSGAFHSIRNGKTNTTRSIEALCYVLNADSEQSRFLHLVNCESELEILSKFANENHLDLRTKDMNSILQSIRKM